MFVKKRKKKVSEVFLTKCVDKKIRIKERLYFRWLII